MSTFFQKLLLKLGKVGSTIVMVIFAAIPFAVINLPWWIEYVMFFLTCIFPFALTIVWAVCCIFALSGPQSLLTFIYYVFFAVVFVIPFIKDMFN